MERGKVIVKGIDDQLIAEMRRISGISDPEEAVELAMSEYLRVHGRRDRKKLARDRDVE